MGYITSITSTHWNVCRFIKRTSLTPTLAPNILSPVATEIEKGKLGKMVGPNTFIGVSPE